MDPSTKGLLHPMKTLRLASAFLLGALGAANAQFDVGQLWANTVKAGTSWGSVRLRLDTLDLDVTISDGLVRTKATMTWTPGMVTTYSSRAVSSCAKISDTSAITLCSTKYVYDTLQTVVADSLEMRGYLQLPKDAAATGLWLWVDGEKQSAFAMDRWKARQQYNQIVGARRDPALLETWGNGSYNLSLFPLKSGESRKLQIEIVQALKEGMTLPVVSRGAYRSYDYATGTYRMDTLRAGHVRFSVRADGPTATVLDLGALGRIAPTTESVVKEFDRPDSVVVAVSGKQPDIWTAVRDGKGAFGADMTFKGAELKFAAEPVKRVIVLDADTNLERSRKLALLSLLKYGRAPHKVNLVWNEEGVLRHLWPDAVSLDESSGREAVSFLKSWKPSAKADARSILRKVATTDSGAIVVLVSTSPYPVLDLVYPGYPTNWSDSLQVQAYRSYSDSSNRFWTALNADWTEIGQKMAASGQFLFGWWNDYHASNAASLTGGYGFGSVSYPWNRWWLSSDSISAPALFGPDRYGWRETPANLKLEIDGIETDSVAVQFQRYWGWYGCCFIGRPQVLISVAMADRKLPFSARSSVAADPGVVAQDTLPVLFAARYAKGGPAKLRVSGTWGGLKFTGERSVLVPEPSGTEWGSRVWAGLYANMIQPWIWTDTATETAARRLGKGYGVVTPAVSFMALEPGVKPLDSAAVQVTGTSDAKSDMVLTASASQVRSVSDVVTVEQSIADVSLDSTSLDDLFAGRMVTIKKTAMEVKPVGLRILTGSVVNLEVVGHDAGDARVRILDLKGREVARIAMVRTGERFTAAWAPTGRGVFFAVAEGDRWKHTSGFTVGR